MIKFYLTGTTTGLESKEAKSRAFAHHTKGGDNSAEAYPDDDGTWTVAYLNKNPVQPGQKPYDASLHPHTGFLYVGNTAHR